MIRNYTIDLSVILQIKIFLTPNFFKLYSLLDYGEGLSGQDFSKFVQ